LSVFKYIDKEHLENFKSTGRVLTSTLRSFQTAEEKIRDPNEGQHITQVIPKGIPITLSPIKAHNTYPNVQFSADSGITINTRAKAESTIEVPDTFVFCASLKYSERIRKGLGKNAHYRIVDIHGFAYTLFGALRKKEAVECYKVKSIRYTEKPVRVENQAETNKIQEQDYWSICFNKDKFFSWQQEIRIVFALNSTGQIKSKVIDVPELRGYCRF
jgi:hypothetical protein